MRNDLKKVKLAGVSGGADVTLNGITHGLDPEGEEFSAREKKRDASATGKVSSSNRDTGIAHLHAQALGELTSGIQGSTKPDGGSGASDKKYRVSPFNVVLERWQDTYHSLYSTLDSTHHEALELADRAVKSTLRDILTADAVLFIPPDEFTQFRKQLEEYARMLVTHAKDTTESKIKKSPLSESELKQKLQRDFRTQRFRKRHNALYQYGADKSAPETGIAPVGVIDGKNGSIGPDHSRVKAGTR